MYGIGMTPKLLLSRRIEQKQSVPFRIREGFCACSNVRACMALFPCTYPCFCTHFSKPWSHVVNCSSCGQASKNYKVTPLAYKTFVSSLEFTLLKTIFIEFFLPVRSSHNLERPSRANCSGKTFNMCERHQTEVTYKNCTATPKHKITKWIPVPCAANCGTWFDRENMGSSTNKTPGTICPKC